MDGMMMDGRIRIDRAAGGDIMVGTLVLVDTYSMRMDG